MKIKNSSMFYKILLNKFINLLISLILSENKLKNNRKYNKRNQKIPKKMNIFKINNLFFNLNKIQLSKQLIL